MKIKKGENFNLGLNVFLLLLTLIVSNMVVYSTFEVIDYQVMCSVFTFPFVFYFANRILRIVDKKNFIDILMVVVLIQLIVFYLMNGNVVVGDFASIIAFIIAQVINMLLFDKKVKKSEISFIQIFFVYASVLIIDAVLFYLFMGILLDMSLFYSIIIKVMVGLGISIMDYLEIKE